MRDATSLRKGDAVSRLRAGPARVTIARSLRRKDAETIANRLAVYGATVGEDDEALRDPVRPTPPGSECVRHKTAGESQFKRGSSPGTTQYSVFVLPPFVEAIGHICHRNSVQVAEFRTQKMR